MRVATLATGEVFLPQKTAIAASIPDIEAHVAATHRLVPRSGFLVGDIEHFLLVPKNRYKLTPLPGVGLRTDYAVGWLTEANTPEAYDQLWGNDEVVNRYTQEDNGIRVTLCNEIIEASSACISPGSQVVDIGCGSGDLLASLNERVADLQLAGCDFSPAAIQRVKARLSGAFTTHVIDRTLPYADHSFDVVYCTDVLEHLEYPAEIVGELVRICRPGGQVIMVVPDGTADDFFGHLWFWTPHSFPTFLRPWQGKVSRLPVSRELMGLIEVTEKTGKSGADAS